MEELQHGSRGRISLGDEPQEWSYIRSDFFRIPPTRLNNDLTART